MEQGLLPVGGGPGINLITRASVTDTITLDGTNTPIDLPFDGFPCGKAPSNYNMGCADGTGCFDNGQRLACNYFTEVDEYECECPNGDCPVVVDIVKSTFGGDEQPCTANGYSLNSQVKTWWW